jgi:hypothetical protein
MKASLVALMLLSIIHSASNIGTNNFSACCGWVCSFLGWLVCWINHKD